jgi:hypothetical protein
MLSPIAQESEERNVEAIERARNTPALTSEDLPDDSRAIEVNAREPLNARRGLAQLKKYLSGKQWSALLYWMPLAFLLRLFLILRFEQVISPDGVQYVALGRNLIAGNFREGLSTYWSPLYPLLVGFSSLFFRDAEFAGRFVSVLAGSILLIPSYRLIRNWYGERVASLGACLIALHPLLIYYSTVLLTESTYTLFFTCGVLAGWSALAGGRARSFLLAGATFGACYLLKPEAAGFLLLLLVPTLGRKLFDRTNSFKTDARNALLLCAGFMLLAAPYLFYLRQQTGAWMLSGKTAVHLWQGSRLAGGDLAPRILPLIPDLTTAFVQVTKALRSEYEIFNLIFPPTFVLLAGLGLFRKSWTSGRVRRELYLFSFVAATLAGYAVTLPNIRFLVPLLPLLLCWLSNGVVEFAEWVIETLLRAKGAGRFLPYVRKFIAPLIVACLLASLLPLSFYLLRGDKWGDYYGQKLSALWIKEHDDASAPVIMSTVPVASFYATGRHVELLDEDYATLIARARREGVGYLVVNERDFKNMSLRFLLDDESIHPGLRLVHSIADAPGHRILVYAVDESEESATP